MKKVTFAEENDDKDELINAEDIQKELIKTNQTKDSKSDKIPAKDVELIQVHEKDFDFVNSEAGYAGGYPTGDAPTRRLDLVRAIFQDLRTSHFRAARLFQKRAEEGKRTKWEQKGRYTRWFGDMNMKKINFGDAGRKMAMKKSAKQFSQCDLAELFTLSPGGRELVETDVGSGLGELHVLSFKGRMLAEDEDGGDMRGHRNDRHQDSKSTRQGAVQKANVMKTEGEETEGIKKPGQIKNPNDNKNLDQAQETNEIEGNDCISKNDHEYWRPSFMFHWLKAIGGNVKDAYKEFEDYKGRESYEELGLDHPQPPQQDGDDDGDAWSHMSGYDEIGLALETSTELYIEDSRQCEHCDDSRLRMDVSYDDADETPVGKQRSEFSVERMQTYQVKEWHNMMDDPTIACFTRGARTIARSDQYDDESEEGEDERFVCNMTGEKWEQLPFPIIVGSGASASVIPTSWCPHIPVTPTQQSEAGEFFRAANGEKIYNRGQKLITMMTQEGVHRDMKFIACNEVSKALGSVSQMCRSGHRVVFNPGWDQEGSYIEHIESGQRLWMEEKNGLYMFNTKIAPTSKQTVNRRNQGFGWQVSL